MKKLFLVTILISMLFIVSCGPEDAAPETPEAIANLAGQASRSELSTCFQDAEGCRPAFMACYTAECIGAPRADRMACIDTCLASAQGGDEEEPDVRECTEDDWELGDWGEWTVECGAAHRERAKELVGDCEPGFVPEVVQEEERSCDERLECVDNVCVHPAPVEAPRPAQINLNSCGRLTENGMKYVLTESLSEIDGTCFTIPDGTVDVELDCQQNSIEGTGTGVGVYISSSDQITVTNCAVSNFEFGIRAFGTDNGRYTDNVIRNNQQFGLQVVRGIAGHIEKNIAEENCQAEQPFLQCAGIATSSSSTNTIRDNRANNNRMNGMYFTGTDGNAIISNVASNNDRDGMVFSSRTYSNSVRDNVVNSNGRQGIALPHTNGFIHFESNTACGNAQNDRARNSDFRCNRNVEDVTGSGNTFGTVRECQNNWPSEEHYQHCP